MPRPKRQKRQAQEVTPHIIEDDAEELMAVQDFLDVNHPSNDVYMKSLTMIQRQIMGMTHRLRPKQVNILKSVFAGKNYTEAAELHKTTAGTVSRLVRSADGSALLSALNYHQNMIEGANIAQRRNLLWRIAIDNEKVEPKVTISAVSEMNKMTFADHTNAVDKNIKPPSKESQKVINIDQTLLPQGALDK